MGPHSSLKVKITLVPVRQIPIPILCPGTACSVTVVLLGPFRQMPDDCFLPYPCEFITHIHPVILLYIYRADCIVKWTINTWSYHDVRSVTECDCVSPDTGCFQTPYFSHSAYLFIKLLRHQSTIIRKNYNSWSLITVTVNLAPVIMRRHRLTDSPFFLFKKGVTSTLAAVGSANNTWMMLKCKEKVFILRTVARDE